MLSAIRRTWPLGSSCSRTRVMSSEASPLFFRSPHIQNIQGSDNKAKIHKRATIYGSSIECQPLQYECLIYRPQILKINVYMGIFLKLQQAISSTIFHFLIR